MALALKVAGRGAAGIRQWRTAGTFSLARRTAQPSIHISSRPGANIQQQVLPISSIQCTQNRGIRRNVDYSIIQTRPQIVLRGRQAWTIRITSRPSVQSRHASTSSPPPSPSPSPSPSPLKNPIKTLKQLTPHENIYTIPNILTFTRLIAAPAIGYLILTSQPLAAFLLFTYAGITDLVDGYLARRLNQFTVVGSVIDPMADKLLMAICVLSLGYVGTFPWWLVVIIFGRDFGLAISAIWWRYISLPPPKTFLRYWDFSLPSAEVHPTEISKINTLLQLLLVGNAMVLPVLPEAWTMGLNLWGVLGGWEYLVAGTTVWSGLSYIGNKDAVKIVSQKEVQQHLDKREAEKDVRGASRGEDEG